MSAYRLLRLCLHLFAGLLTCALIFPWIAPSARMRRIQRWSIKLVAICGVRIEVLHQPGAQADKPVSRALIVANHISWLDIFVMNAYLPCHFVAKADIRNWPLIGWLCSMAGTIFLSRGRVRDVRKTFEGLVTSLHAGEHVAFFPEGTTAPQGALLPFHANLFEAAIDANVPVQPYALRYVDADGQLHAAADFADGISFVRSVLLIARARGLRAQLIVLPVMQTDGAHRRELANEARRLIGMALDEQIRQEI